MLVGSAVQVVGSARVGSARMGDGQCGWWVVLMGSARVGGVGGQCEGGWCWWAVRGWVMLMGSARVGGVDGE